MNVVTTIHMAAALTSCRMAVVCTGQTIGYLVGANRHINQSSLPGEPFLVHTIGSYQSIGVFTGCRILTIESLLMSGCGQDY